MTSMPLRGSAELMCRKTKPLWSRTWLGSAAGSRRGGSTPLPVTAIGTVTPDARSTVRTYEEVTPIPST